MDFERHATLLFCAKSANVQGKRRRRERKSYTMKLNEAIEVVRIYINSEYVCSGKIYDVAYKHHAGDSQMFVKLCKEIAA